MFINLLLYLKRSLIAISLVDFFLTESCSAKHQANTPNNLSSFHVKGCKGTDLKSFLIILHTMIK